MYKYVDGTNSGMQQTGVIPDPYILTSGTMNVFGVSNTIIGIRSSNTLVTGATVNIFGVSNTLIGTPSSNTLVTGATINIFGVSNTFISGFITNVFGISNTFIGIRSSNTTVSGFITNVFGTSVTTLGITSSTTTVNGLTARIGTSTNYVNIDSTGINFFGPQVRINSQCINSIRLDLCSSFRERLDPSFIYSIFAPFNFNITSLPYFNANSFTTSNRITFDIQIGSTSIYSVKPELWNERPAGQFGTLTGSSISVLQGQNITLSSSFAVGAVAYGVIATLLCN